MPFLKVSLLKLTGNWACSLVKRKCTRVILIATQVIGNNKIASYFDSKTRKIRTYVHSHLWSLTQRQLSIFHWFGTLLCSSRSLLVSSTLPAFVLERRHVTVQVAWQFYSFILASYMFNLSSFVLSSSLQSFLYVSVLFSFLFRRFG